MGQVEIVETNTELPIFVGGDHQFVLGRGDIHRSKDGSFELYLSLNPEAGRQLMEMLAGRIPVGINIVQSPTRHKES